MLGVNRDDDYDDYHIHIHNNDDYDDHPIYNNDNDDDSEIQKEACKTPFSSTCVFLDVGVTDEIDDW
ncbi:hypothetical protein O0I10_007894 [Lichtheimia ornata]|uniref:Uncharacterized protein n=1 Tax=Lichtheimia ornata TaxID=688661 RepID=A0AAD7XVU2_9FUNG|nr:uncharacterized protein O0I10_007894 [Lichtheimia ornata]KAJ8656330.1 hypothetical protein O0I10_007894 [Lichtheimia ornata]